MAERASHNPALIAAMAEIPREAFLAPELAGVAYDRLHLPIPEGQTLPPPDVIATMIEALELPQNARVLQIGTGTGYTAALLSRLAQNVYSVERIPALADFARKRVAALNIENVEIRTGDGVEGWASQGPYHAILISACGVQAPRSLRDQLAIGGRLVMPIGPHRTRQTLLRVTRTGASGFSEERLGEIRFVERLGDLLVEMGAVGREDADRAADDAKGRRIGDVLRDVARLEERDIYRALALQRGLRFATIDQLVTHVDLELVRSVSRSFLEHNRVVPVAHAGDAVTVATPDLDPSIADLAKLFHPSRLEICIVTPTDYRRLWTAVDMMLSGRHLLASDEARRAAVADDILEHAQDQGEAHFIQLFESMLTDAVAERASDIHLERYGDHVRVRLRVDGDLRDLDRYRLAPTELLGIVNVVKIRANLDIAERRLPQGGRIRLRAGGRNFDLRVQTQPALHGEHVVIRLLPQDVKILTIEELGFPGPIAMRYRRLLDHPNGLVLVVGPTGSGKTTTLYAGLQILAQDRTRKVITVEDPIEYAIEGIQQTQVRPEIGFHFSDAMRAFVREDPDVILVGEIRDHETALEAIRASQTGHLVFSTLHCNDSTDAIQRLFDLGMHPNSIASELLAVISQRLARRICEGCRQPAVPEPAILKECFPGGAPADFACFKGAGCTRCGGYGSKGRVACIEFLTADAHVRAAISRHPPLEELRALALDAGLLTMRDNTLDHVRRGVIALTEVPTLLAAERMAPERRQ
jgi:type IV pilus assembly protein PilB